MPEFDPGGQFAAAKGPMLSVLEPLITLLGKCEKDTLTRAGLNDALTTFRSTKRHVVVLDYFLGPDVAATGPAARAAKTKARKASLDLLGQIGRTSWR